MPQLLLAARSELVPDDINEFLAEAEAVSLMTRTDGYQILKRDLDRFRNDISTRLPYLEADTKEYKESRNLYIGIDKFLTLIDDYAKNRDEAIKLVARMENPKTEVALDIDNEI